jgi:hypothetical protein
MSKRSPPAYQSVLGRYEARRIAANTGSVHDVEFPLLMPGIKVSTSPTNYRGFNLDAA